MKNQRGLVRITLSTLAACGLFGAFASASFADTPGSHPHYLHALTDLRYARALLAQGDEPNVVVDEGSAITEIDQAIGEIKRAAIDDGKNLGDHPPMDANLSRKDRLRKALALLGSARKDLTVAREDDQAAIGWRNHALGDISHAANLTTKAIKADYHDDHPALGGSHPEYLKALADLRKARGMLTATDEGNVMIDEGAAMEALTDAIKQAKRAAIDDGQDVFFNPPADNNLPRRNRLRQALKLEQDAHTRLTRKREANDRALDAMADTVTALDKAIRNTQQALRDDHRDDRR